MRIPRYWARSTTEVAGPRAEFTGPLTCWGWSDTSEADAAQMAASRARSAAATLEAGGHADSYGYLDRPIREERLDELRVGGELAGVLTRNGYGSIVLNAARTMFVDVDEPVDGGPVTGGMLGRLLGLRSLRQRAERLVAEEPGLRVILYATAAGSRCLVLGRAFDPASDESMRIMGALGSDPMYRRLCAAQDSFRARLTPKCWRCGLAPPRGGGWPFRDAAEEARVRDWEARYESAVAGWSTCRLAAEIRGDDAPETLSAAEELIRTIHDGMAVGAAGAPLA
jgi:hypothetical protein